MRLYLVVQWLVFSEKLQYCDLNTIEYMGIQFNWKGKEMPGRTLAGNELMSCG